MRVCGEREREREREREKGKELVNSFTDESGKYVGKWGGLCHMRGAGLTFLLSMTFLVFFLTQHFLRVLPSLTFSSIGRNLGMCSKCIVPHALHGCFDPQWIGTQFSMMQFESSSMGYLYEKRGTDDKEKVLEEDEDEGRRRTKSGDMSKKSEESSSAE